VCERLEMKQFSILGKFIFYLSVASILILAANFNSVIALSNSSIDRSPMPWLLFCWKTDTQWHFSMVSAYKSSLYTKAEIIKSPYQASGIPELNNLLKTLHPTNLIWQSQRDFSDSEKLIPPIMNLPGEQIILQVKDQCRQRNIPLYIPEKASK
jgi:hypothetical protein